MKEIDIVFNIDYNSKMDVGPLYKDIPKYIEFIQVNDFEQFKRLVYMLEDDMKCYIWVHPSFSAERVEKGYKSNVMSESVPILEKLNIEFIKITRSTGKTNEKGFYDVNDMLLLKSNGIKVYSAKELKEKILYEQAQIKEIETKEIINSLPVVVILTAIQEEYKAVRNHLDDIIDDDKEDIGYESGIFNYNDIPIAKVIIRECGPKNTKAAQETQRAIYHFKPACMFFVGIAGSRKQKDFDVGDVIFPEQIYSYESGKAEKGSFLARPNIAKSSVSLFEKAKKERSKEDWKSLIIGDWEQEFKADIGIIASGEQLIEHYDSQIGKILTDHYNDTHAVEMEGFGFADVASRQGGIHDNIKVGVVRGISDIIKKDDDSNKSSQNTDNRPLAVKEMASATASAFAYWLIYKTYS